MGTASGYAVISGLMAASSPQTSATSVKVHPCRAYSIDSA